MSRRDAVDLFSGAGGWDVAAREMGLDVLGVERDAAACETRRANGLPTVEGDVRQHGPGFLRSRGLIGSPVCQPMSQAGNGEGRRVLDLLIEAIRLRGCVDVDERTALTLEPFRWAMQALDAGRPYEWIALEQVPAVLPVWEAMAEELREEGYSVATGKISSERYGVPQVRKRAVLVARLDGEARLPAPTHNPVRGKQSDDLLPPVTMNDCLAALDDEWMSREVYGKPRVHRSSDTDIDLSWVERRPATTVVACKGLVPHPGANRNRFNGLTKSRNDGLRVTLAEAAALQTFPADFEWRGTKGEIMTQIGNAVPPRMAGAVLSACVSPSVQENESEEAA